MIGNMMKLTHINSQGEANMVDVTDKSVTVREAIAQGFVDMKHDTLALIQSGDHKKGDVFAVARIAGIQAAKKCADLIPLCHPLALSKITIEFEVNEETPGVKISCYCKLSGKTGVEMEALTGVSIAALTLFDMCKAVDAAMTIRDIQLIEKRGGKSGYWQRQSKAD